MLYFQKSREISGLLMQLGEETALLDGYSLSPTHKVVAALRKDDPHLSPSRLSQGKIKTNLYT